MSSEVGSEKNADWSLDQWAATCGDGKITERERQVRTSLCVMFTQAWEAARNLITDWKEVHAAGFATNHACLKCAEAVADLMSLPSVPPASKWDTPEEARASYAINWMEEEVKSPGVFEKYFTTQWTRSERDPAV